MSAAPASSKQLVQELQPASTRDDSTMKAALYTGSLKQIPAGPPTYDVETTQFVLARLCCMVGGVSLRVQGWVCAQDFRLRLCLGRCLTG